MQLLFLLAQTVTDFADAFQIGIIHCHRCIVWNFQFRKFLPVHIDRYRTVTINLNYSRSSIWTGNCTMNPKIDPCSLNIAQPISKKGIKSLWQSSERLLSCQGSLIVTIPAVHSAYRYLKVSHRVQFYKGSCYTAWMWYILLNELLLQQSSAVLSGRYQCVVFAYLLITPIF